MKLASCLSTEGVIPDIHSQNSAEKQLSRFTGDQPCTHSLPVSSDQPRLPFPLAAVPHSSPGTARVPPLVECILPPECSRDQL